MRMLRIVLGMLVWTACFYTVWWWSARPVERATDARRTLSPRELAPTLWNYAVTVQPQVELQLDGRTTGITDDLLQRGRNRHHEDAMIVWVGTTQ